MPLLVDTKVPKTRTKSSTLEVYINKEVVKILTDVSTEYTRYIYQIAQQISSKYSSLFYKKICSWKHRKEVTVLLEELYKEFCIDKIYSTKDGKVNYSDFKHKVLEKAKKELFQKADCYFEYTENYKGRSVYSITFKVIDK